MITISVPFPCTSSKLSKCYLSEHSLYFEWWQHINNHILCILPCNLRMDSEKRNGPVECQPQHLVTLTCRSRKCLPQTREKAVCEQSQGKANSVSTLSWPPTSQTVKLMFLYSTVSTLNPANFPEALGQC